MSILDFSCDPGKEFSSEVGAAWIASYNFEVSSLGRGCPQIKDPAILELPGRTSFLLSTQP